MPPSLPPRGSVFVTALAWTTIVLSALLIPISGISLLMILVKSYGTASTTAMGFFSVVVAPPMTFFAGIGFLRRWKWAWAYVLLLLALFIASNAWQLLSPRPETTTYTSTSGMPTTTFTSYGSDRHHLPIVLICAALLVKLLTPSVRSEFWDSQKSSGPPATPLRPVRSCAMADAPAPPPIPAGTNVTVKQRVALLLAIVLVLSIASGMAWLVKSGLQKGTTFFPAKQISQQRPVSRQQEPAMFWVAIGLYSAIGIGTGGLGLWGIREVFRRNLPRC